MWFRLSDRPDMAIDVYNGLKTTSTHTALHLQCPTVSEYPSTRSVVQDALDKIQTSLCICIREQNRQLYRYMKIHQLLIPTVKTVTRLRECKGSVGAVIAHGSWPIFDYSLYAQVIRVLTY